MILVGTVSKIAEVQLLARCRDELTPTEVAAIAELMEHLKTRLHGLEVARGPQDYSLSERADLAANGPHPANSPASKQNRVIREWNDMTIASGGPAKLPPRWDILAAAEAWIIASVVGGRMNEPVDPLFVPWATISYRP